MAYSRIPQIKKAPIARPADCEPHEVTPGCVLASDMSPECLARHQCSVMACCVLMSSASAPGAEPRSDLLPGSALLNTPTARMRVRGRVASRPHVHSTSWHPCAHACSHVSTDATACTRAPAVLGSTQCVCTLPCVPAYAHTPPGSSRLRPRPWLSGHQLRAQASSPSPGCVV